MQRQIRLLISALALACLAIALWAVAMFFRDQIGHIVQTCAYHDLTPAECYANDENRIQLAADLIGVSVFALTGLAAWSVATFAAFKWFGSGRPRARSEMTKLKSTN